MSCRLLQAKVLPHQANPGHRPLAACVPRTSRASLSITMSTVSVQEYIDKHDLSKKVEEAINQTVKVKPDEPLSYMVSAPPPL